MFKLDELLISYPRTTTKAAILNSIVSNSITEILGVKFILICQMKIPKELPHYMKFW